MKPGINEFGPRYLYNPAHAAGHGLFMRLPVAVLLLAVSASSALAQRGPEIVIPGKPGVPVYINGVDASWSVVVGEFGLDRPNEAAPTVVYQPDSVPLPYRVPSYYPADGRQPGYGRLEIVPPRNRVLPPPAPTYRRSWSSESAPDPVSEYQFYPAAAGAFAHAHGYRRRSGKPEGESHTDR
jgi:hypothetical protein